MCPLLREYRGIFAKKDDLSVAQPVNGGEKKLIINDNNLWASFEEFIPATRCAGHRSRCAVI